MSEAFLQPEIERLLSKAALYGPGTVWKQNEFSEILPFPKPLSLSVFRGLAAHNGATGRTCRELGLFYNPDLPVEDYLETLFGRMFVNDAAERLLTQPKGKQSVLKSLSASVRLEKENRSFYCQFGQLLDKLEAYYNEQRSVEHQKSSDSALVNRVIQLNDTLNDHYTLVVKSGILANINLESLSSANGGTITPDLLSSDISQLIRGDRPAEQILDFRAKDLAKFIGFSASVEYELGCPRFMELEKSIIEPDFAAHGHGAELPRSRKLRDLLTRFRLHESLKVIFKTLLLREIYLIRMTLLEIGRRTGLGEDIFYLTLAETVSVFARQFHSEIMHRKAGENAYLSIDLPTLVTPAALKNILFDGGPLEHHELKGISVNGAGFEGHVLPYQSDKDIEKANQDTIIVAKHASPNLVMAFGRCSGIITETGGLLSHLAIVAREHGFPLVLQARDAARLLKDGDRVIVDSKGKIEKI